jgi:hypothetical protein
MLRSTTLSAATPMLAILLAAGTPGGALAQHGFSHHATATSEARVRSGGASSAFADARVRSYVLTDPRTGAPTEVGILVDESAIERLPMQGKGHHGAGHGPVHSLSIALPKGHGTPFQFVELNWNPQGHEPDSVYGRPHFDAHFYTITPAERDAIAPSDPQWAAKANRLPSGDLMPQFVAALTPPGAKPADLAVPRMGVHWVDVRSPELQGLLGKPDAYRPFTSTFIQGSWDGRFIFLEPMWTLDRMLAKRSTDDPRLRDEVIPIPTPARYATPGYWPTAYRITWEPATREWRIALTDLVRRG